MKNSYCVIRINTKKKKKQTENTIENYFLILPKVYLLNGVLSTRVGKKYQFFGCVCLVNQLGKAPKNMFLRWNQVNQTNIWKMRQFIQDWEGLLMILMKTSLIYLDEKE